VAGEERDRRLGSLRRAAGLGYLGEAVVGADVEWVGRVGAAGIHLLAVAVGAFAHCERGRERKGNSFFLFFSFQFEQRSKLAFPRRRNPGFFWGALTEDVEREAAAGAAALIAAARPGVQLAGVAVRAPLVPTWPRQRRSLGDGDGDGAVLGAAVEGVGGVGAVRVDRLLPRRLSAGLPPVVRGRRPGARPRPAAAADLLLLLLPSVVLDALAVLLRLVDDGDLALLLNLVAARGPVLRRVGRPRPRTRRRRRVARVDSPRLLPLASVVVVVLRVGGGSDTRSAVSVLGCPVLRRHRRRPRTRRRRLAAHGGGGGFGGGRGGDGAVRGAAVEGVGGVGAVRVDALRLHASSSVVHHLQQAAAELSPQRGYRQRIRRDSSRDGCLVVGGTGTGRRRPDLTIEGGGWHGNGRGHEEEEGEGVQVPSRSRLASGGRRATGDATSGWQPEPGRMAGRPVQS
jgi:hypothetical protein